jgi:NADH dehydrogenase FAD-containing subunit
VALNLAQHTVQCADGTVLPFDALSIDTGPMPAWQRLPGAAEHVLALRPIEAFIAAWPQVVARIQATNQAFHLVFVGAGAAGVELAFAAQRRARTEGWAHLRVTLIGSDDRPLAGLPAAAQHKALRLLAERGITYKGGHRVAAVQAGQLHFEAHPVLAFDACIVATGTAAPTWPAASRLAVDEGGFISVGPTLQSTSHPNIFAAGDVAAYAEPRPKSGVFAVRAGPVLAHNLRAFCAGEALQDWQPQARALYLISTGEQHALATWGPWSWSGRWVWRWKDRIDRRFVQGYST